MEREQLEIIGWREWVGLPELGIEKIKAKIDTGAKTSTLHAFDLKHFKKDGKEWVQFMIHPQQKRQDITLACRCELFDNRWITDSGGRSEQRFIIKTPIILGNQSWPIEISLSDRNTMRFRMLLGRSVIKNHFLVDCARSYVHLKR